MRSGSVQGKAKEEKGYSERRRLSSIRIKPKGNQEL